MTQTTFIKTNAGGEYEWLNLSDGQQSSHHGDVEQLVDSAEAETSFVFLAPAETTLFREVEYDSTERSIFRKTIPYSLEDDLVNDVEDLHFAFSTPENDKVLVTAIAKTSVDQWLGDFNAENLELKKLVPEGQLIPLFDNGWTLLVDGDRWLLRYGIAHAVAIEKDTALIALQLLLDEAEQFPDKLYLFTSSGQYEEVLQLLPELLRGITQWQEKDYWDVIADNYNPSVLLNILQGDYAQRLPYLKWVSQWRTPLILLAVVLVVQLLAGLANQYKLSQENVELRREVESIVRQVIPTGPADPVRLRRKVSSMQGSTSEGFVSLLNQSASLLMRTKGLSIKSLNYNERQNEIRLTIIVDSFKDVETVRASLEESGLEAQMTGSNQDGDKVRAGLKIKG